MSAPLLCPTRPCRECPFRKDTPPGIWHPSEYRKLPLYDKQAPELAVFHCHQENATGIPTVCKGWLAVFGFEALAVRLAVSRGELTVEQVEAPCKVGLYATGAEACAAGLAGVKRPGVKAQRAIEKLVKRGVGKDHDAEVSAFVRALKASEEPGP